VLINCKITALPGTQQAQKHEYANVLVNAAISRQKGCYNFFFDSKYLFIFDRLDVLKIELLFSSIKKH
jgi:hypothetical protein